MYCAVLSYAGTYCAWSLLQHRHTYLLSRSFHRHTKLVCKVCITKLFTSLL